ncbi:MAG: RNA methyltransferase [Tenericutes bacterium]|nr:RNA methyltransferase [Mycoplasmatota bacterium]
MLITSKDNNRIKEVRKLLNKKYSLQKGLFVIEGENLVEEAIKNDLLVELFVLDGYSCNYEFNYDTVTLDVMKSMSDLKSTPRLLGVSKIKNNNKIGNKILILDGIQDPGNAGTIIRNSVAFDIDTIIFSNDSVSPYNEKVLRSTGGMIFNTNILIGNIEELIKEIKDKNIKVIGTSLKSSISLEKLEKIDEFAIIFGNEGNGVKEDILNLCDKIVRIDMNPKCESLNVGVSSAIILYYLYK